VNSCTAQQLSPTSLKFLLQKLERSEEVAMRQDYGTLITLLQLLIVNKREEAGRLGREGRCALQEVASYTRHIVKALDNFGEILIISSFPLHDIKEYGDVVVNLQWLRTSTVEGGEMAASI